MCWWTTAVVCLCIQSEWAAADLFCGSLAKPSFRSALMQAVTITIRFEGTRGFGFTSDMAVDDVSLDEAPACPSPTAFALVASTATTVELSWTSGGAANWQIEYGPAGFLQGRAAWFLLPPIIHRDGTQSQHLLRLLCARRTCCGQRRLMDRPRRLQRPARRSWPRILRISTRCLGNGNRSNQ